MSDYINDLFEALAEKEDFQKLGRIISEETNEQLKEYQTKLLQADYERIRDIVFSVSAVTRKEAFSTGFKTAMRLLFECRNGK